MLRLRSFFKHISTIKLNSCYRPKRVWLTTSNLSARLGSLSHPSGVKKRGRYRHKMHIFIEYTIRITKENNAFYSTCNTANLSKFWLYIYYYYFRAFVSQNVLSKQKNASKLNVCKCLQISTACDLKLWVLGWTCNCYPQFCFI